jgi:hypothetical protein
MGDAMSEAIYFLSGVLTTGYLIAALFFLRFWSQSRDRLFAFFAVGFALLALQRMLLLVIQPVELLYGVRLLAFLIIAGAIVDRNRR